MSQEHVYIGFIILVELDSFLLKTIAEITSSTFFFKCHRTFSAVFFSNKGAETQKIKYLLSMKKDVIILGLVL